MISVKVPSSSADSSPTSVLRRNEQPSLVPPGLTGSRRARRGLQRCPSFLLAARMMEQPGTSCSVMPNNVGPLRAWALALSRGGYVAVTGQKFDEVSPSSLPSAIALLRSVGVARPAGSPLAGSPGGTPPAVGTRDPRSP